MNEKSVKYLGWTQVVIAALAMVATFPGRTHGLGLITESLLKDLSLERTEFAQLNAIATLVGALFCLPIGGWLDRFGVRIVLPIVLGLLGICVCLMSGVQTATPLLVLVLLTRGLGQSALSVVSISMIGKWFDKLLGIATGIYSVLMGIFFATAFSVVGAQIRGDGWRSAWWNVGAALLVFAIVSPLITRRGAISAADSDLLTSTAAAKNDVNLTLRQALETPAFWIFGGATSLFGLVASGMSLFNESILIERGFSTEIYHQTLTISFLIGTVANLAGGALAQFCSMQRLLTVALLIYALGLLAMTQIATLLQLQGTVVLLAVSGGLITVIFFAIWRRAFGKTHLGQIQGAGQMMTVLASAGGPTVFAECHAAFGSYAPALYGLAGTVVLFSFAAWFVTLPTEQAVEPSLESVLST